MDIYEFSTGINIQNDAQGNWWSVGYLGGWMYNTYGSRSATDIPYPIQQAYDNKEFAVGQNDKSEFTIMGRVISLNNEVWSVVAFLTYASDERGRRVPTYRFFFGEGSTAIAEILRCIITFEKKYKTLPIFNHLGATDLNQYIPADLADINHQIGNDTNPEVLQTPDIRTYVLEPDTCVVNNSYALSLFKLNRLALNRARAIGEAGNVSWAYNADVLQRPETFILIEAANKNAYNYLRSKRSGGIVKYQAGINEQGIRAALKGLIEYEDIDKTAVEDLKFLANAIPALGSEAEVYVRTIAKGLGLSEQSLLHQTHPELVKLDIVLSVFFPNIQKQLEVWQRLSNSGWNKLIAQYTEKIKKYISEAKIDHLEANQEIVKHCFDNIDFTVSSVDNRRTEYIVWILTKSLWSSAATTELFYRYITEEIDKAFRLSRENASSNRDKFKLENYLRNLRKLKIHFEIPSKLTVSDNSKDTFRWRWFNLFEIEEQNESTKKKLKSLEGKIEKPELHYEQMVEILLQLSNIDNRFEKASNFFKIVNSSFDNQFVRILPSQQRDITNRSYTLDSLDRLIVDNDSINKLKKAQFLGKVNLYVSLFIWLIIIAIGGGIIYGIWQLLVVIGQFLRNKLEAIIALITLIAALVIALVVLLLVSKLFSEIYVYFTQPPKQNSRTSNTSVIQQSRQGDSTIVKGNIINFLATISSIQNINSINLTQEGRNLLSDIFRSDNHNISEIARQVFETNQVDQNFISYFKNDLYNIVQVLFVPQDFQKYIFNCAYIHGEDNSKYSEIKEEAFKYQAIFKQYIIDHSHQNQLKKEIFESWTNILTVKVNKVSRQSEKNKEVSKESILEVLFDFLVDGSSILTIDEFINSLHELVQGKNKILNGVSCKNDIFKKLDLSDYKKYYQDGNSNTSDSHFESAYISTNNTGIISNQHLLLAKFLHNIFKYIDNQLSLKTSEQEDIIRKSIDLAAVFYQIAQDGAPEEIYEGLGESKQAYGISITSYKPKSSLGFANTIKNIFPSLQNLKLELSTIFFMVVLIVLVAALGSIFSNLQPSSPPPIASSSQNPNPTSSATPSPSPTVSLTPSPRIAPTILKDDRLATAKQDGNYNSTIASMETIVKDCKEKIKSKIPAIKDKEIRERISDALTNGNTYSNMNIENIMPNESNKNPQPRAVEKETFLQLIAKFQKEQANRPDPDGIVSNPPDPNKLEDYPTFAALKAKVCPP